MPFPEFQRVLQSKPLNLPLAALLFAREIAYPELDVNHYLARFKRLANEISPQLDPNATLEARAEKLANLLFSADGAGFRGNQENYNDVRNSFLNELLDRRLGIPITLSVLFLTIARRLELPAYGVGLPGHFIVAVRASWGSRPLLLDPFHGGVRLTRGDCVRLVAHTTGFQGPFMPQWLDPTPPEQILVRMLNNLRLNYLNNRSWAEAAAVVRHLRILQPDVIEHLRDEGLIELEAGHFHQAARLLEKYLRGNPTSGDADAIRSGIAPKLTNWVRHN